MRQGEDIATHHNCQGVCLGYSQVHFAQDKVFTARLDEQRESVETGLARSSPLLAIIATCREDVTKSVLITVADLSH